MCNKSSEITKEKNLTSDIINVFLGMIVIVMIIFVFFYPGNKYFLMSAFALGGIINLRNGKCRKKEKKKAVSNYLIITGILMLFIALSILITWN